MYCRNCAMENDDGNEICIGCGKPLVQDGINKKEKKTNKKLLIIMLCAIIVTGTILSFVFRKPTICINDYVVVNTQGYDGYGTAKAVIDWSGIYEDYAPKIKFNSYGRDMYGGVASPIDVLAKCITVSAEFGGNYSNGDMVKYYITVDETYKHSVACRLVYKDGKEKISKLSKLRDIDVFESLNVEFTGDDGYGEIRLSGQNNFIDSFIKEFQYEPKDHYYNGDVVTIYLSDEYIDELQRQQGYRLIATSKEYKVDSLYSYISSVDQISEECINEWKEHTKVDFEATYLIDDYFDYDVSVTSFDFVKGYFYSNIPTEQRTQDMFIPEPTNELVLIFKSTIHNEDDDFYGNAFWYVNVHDVVINKNSEFSSSGFDEPLCGDWFTVVDEETDCMVDCYGFETLEDLMDYLVESLDIDFEKFSEFNPK